MRCLQLPFAATATAAGGGGGGGGANRGKNGRYASDFASLPYRLSCAVLPAIITLHFQRTANNSAQAAPAAATGKETSTITTTAVASCVAAASVYNANTSGILLQELRAVNGEEMVIRHFPVILIFHTIVSLSLWFMQYQTGQHDKNIKMLKKLKGDLTEMKKGQRDKKKR